MRNLEHIISDCDSRPAEWVGPPNGQTKQQAIEAYAAELGLPPRIGETLTKLSDRVRAAAEERLRA